MRELNSAIYVGHVSHQRRSPRRHSLRMPQYMLYLDLSELDAVESVSPLLSIERPNVLSFRRRDYFGDITQDLACEVRDRVEGELGSRPTGPIRMLTQVRAFGYVFNPVTFYYCFDTDGTPTALLAEITNTPWAERYSYVIPMSSEGLQAELDKRFHVSPFMSMDQRYRWRFGVPGQLLAAHIQNREQNRRLFDASLALRRRPLTAGNLHRVLLSYPAMTMRVHAAIYAHALALLARGVPFHPHPSGRAPMRPAPIANEGMEL